MHEAVIRWCDHGETVQGLNSDHGCSGCVAGQCGAYLACEMPEPDRTPHADLSWLPTFTAALRRLFTF